MNGQTKAIPFERKITDLAMLLSTKGTPVIDLTSYPVSRALKRKKAASHSEEISVGCR